MMLGGDEFLRTQMGNNNAWCQDNPISWFDWNLLEEKSNAAFLRFTRLLIAFRKRQPALRRRAFLDDSSIRWHGQIPDKPDFSPASRFIALALDGTRTGREPGDDIYIAFNAAENPATIRIPKPPSAKQWFRVVDTGQRAPDDFVENESSEPLQGMTRLMKGKSLLVLVGGE